MLVCDGPLRAPAFVKLTYWQWPSIGLDNGLALNRWQAIILNNADPIHWCMYVALSGDELTHWDWDNEGGSPFNAGDTFISITFEDCYVLMQISMKLITKGAINKV